MINQRLLFSIAILTIGFLIIFISVIRNTRPQTSLNATSQNEIVLSQLLGKESTGSSSVYSHLPNPGILPDNPIYWLKMIRDRADLLTTPNVIEKADLMILYSNKRLHSGTILLEKGENDLAISTITKAEKYLDKANALVKTADDGSLTERFKSVLIIHRNVLQDLIDNSEIEDTTILQKTLDINTSIIDQYIDSNAQVQESTVEEPETATPSATPQSYPLR